MLCSFFLGTVYQPRFRINNKGEPQRHTLLKTKQTFCLVHGLGNLKHYLYLELCIISSTSHTGTMIYTSYPELGAQGANLVLEVIFRAVKMAMNRKGTKKFKTIYIQVIFVYIFIPYNI